jgi:hypothetical protein
MVLIAVVFFVSSGCIERVSPDAIHGHAQSRAVREQGAVERTIFGRTGERVAFGVVEDEWDRVHRLIVVDVKRKPNL